MKIDFSNDQTPTPQPTFGNLKAGDCYTLPGGSTVFQKVSWDGSWHRVYSVILETGILTPAHPEHTVVFPRPHCVVKVNG